MVFLMISSWLAPSKGSWCEAKYSHRWYQYNITARSVHPIPSHHIHVPSYPCPYPSAQHQVHYDSHRPHVRLRPIALPSRVARTQASKHIETLFKASKTSTTHSSIHSCSHSFIHSFKHHQYPHGQHFGSDVRQGAASCVHSLSGEKHLRQQDYKITRLQAILHYVFYTKNERNTFDRPKSAILILSSVSPHKMFSGFMSRCTIPKSWR